MQVGIRGQVSTPALHKTARFVQRQARSLPLHVSTLKDIAMTPTPLTSHKGGRSVHVHGGWSDRCVLSG